MDRDSASAGWLEFLSERVLASIAGLCLFAMMALTFVQVVWRYFLNTPVTGGEEIQSFLLGLIIFTALPLVTRRERHIAVRSLASLLRGRAVQVQHALVLAGTVVGLAFEGYLLFDQGQSMREEGTLTTFLDVPLAPAAYVLATLAWIAAAMSLERLVQALRGDAAPAPEIAAERAGPE